MERRELGESGISLPVVGLLAGRRFDVRGKEAQSARASLVRTAIDRKMDFFATSPANGEAERVLAASLAGVRHRATVLNAVAGGDEARVHHEIDLALHYFDGWVDLYLLDSRDASPSMLRALHRLRDTGEAGAIGVAATHLNRIDPWYEWLRGGALDFVCLPATLLLHRAADDLMASIAETSAGIIVNVPDLERPFSDAVGASPIAGDLERFNINDWLDLFLKLALSDARVTAAVVPAGRRAELDALAAAARPPWFGRGELEWFRAITSLKPP